MNKTLESILIVSVRGFRYQAANASLYEFEDMIGDLCRTTLFAPNTEKTAQRKFYRAAKYARFTDIIADQLSRMRCADIMEVHHDAIVVVLDNPWQMHLINQIRGWREHPAKKVCFIAEFWPRELSRWRLMKEPFKNFDHIFVGLASVVKPLSQVVDVPCSYLPCGVDTDLFTNHCQPCERVIDISYVGRREDDLHKALKQVSSAEQWFYLFDTAKNQKLFVDNHSEHRLMYSSLLRRTRLSIALPAKSNALAETGGIEEIANRYFEFMAAGVAVVGRAPDSANFRSLFDWDDAVLDIGRDYRGLSEKLKQLLKNREYLDVLAMKNMANSLRKHDWVYRLLTIAEVIGYSPNEKMIDKVDTLQAQAALLE